MATFPSITTTTFDFSSSVDPLQSPWTAVTPSGNTTNLLQSSGGVCSKDQPSSTGFGAQILSTVYGPDTELWAKIVTVTTTDTHMILGMYLRLVQEGAATVDGYYVYVLYNAAGADGWTLTKMTDNTSTTLTTGSHDIAAGDYIGCKIEGTALSAYWCAAASDPTNSSNWTQVATTTDATYSSSGKTAIEIQGTVTTVDDLRVGNVASGSTFTKTGLGIIGP